MRRALHCLAALMALSLVPGAAYALQPGPGYYLCNWHSAFVGTVLEIEPQDCAESSDQLCRWRIDATVRVDEVLQPSKDALTVGQTLKVRTMGVTNGGETSLPGDQAGIEAMRLRIGRQYVLSGRFGPDAKPNLVWSMDQLPWIRTEWTSAWCASLADMPSPAG